MATKKTLAELEAGYKPYKVADPQPVPTVYYIVGVMLDADEGLAVEVKKRFDHGPMEDPSMPFTDDPNPDWNWANYYWRAKE